MKYTDCIFDLYGTLVDIRTDERKPALWRALAAWYKAHGAAYRPKELETAYFAAVAEKEKGMTALRHDSHEAHPEIRLEEVFFELFRQKGVDAGLPLAVSAGERFRALSMDYIRLYPGALELLARLRGAGARLWLLSNAQRIFTEYELRTLGLEGQFDGVYLSSDYGVKKPDRRFFDLLLTERRIDVNTAVMIGNDGVCDVAGARSAGLATVYIRSNISPDEPLPQADYVLEKMDLERVADILL